MSEPSPGTPAGEPYDWFVRAQGLIATGDVDAAASLLRHAVAAEPTAASIRELLARALFDAKRFEDAIVEFTALVDLAPDDDYARFGLGMALWRRQEFTAAADQLAMAVAMRPDMKAYVDALTQVRATQRARAEAGLPADGPLPPRTQP